MIQYFTIILLLYYTLKSTFYEAENNGILQPNEFSNERLL